MLVVDASRPWTSVAELTAYLKQKKEKASYATSNPPAKVMGAIYKARAGLEAVEVPYRTSFDTVNDMRSGALDYALYDPVFASAQARTHAHPGGEHGSAHAIQSRAVDHDGIGRADGLAWLVCRDGADGHAAADRGPDQPVVQRAGRDGGGQAVSQQHRWRPLDHDTG
jgi:hypothetical protein